MAVENEVDIDDLDLDVDPAEEIRRLSAMEDAEGEEPETEADAEVEAPEEEKPQVTAEDTPAEAVAAGRDVLRELQVEKERLQQRLMELEVRAKLSDERLEKLAQQRAVQPQQPEEQGPSAEEILLYVDQQRNAIEDQIEQARQEAPEAVPQLRQQLRQLNQYRDDFKDQQRDLAIQQRLAQERIDPNAVVAETQYRQQYDSTRRAIFQEYPALDRNSKEYNAELAKEIVDIYEPQLAKGKDPIETLTKATVLVMRANGVLSSSERAALEKQKTETEPKPKASPRKAEAVKRNVEAANAQPPNIAGAGKPNEAAVTYDFDKMSDAEFDKLQERGEKNILKALALHDD